MEKQLTFSLFLHIFYYSLIFLVKFQAHAHHIADSIDHHFACIAEKTPALYVFGDSIVDSGNKHNLLTKLKANYLPYGYDFPVRASGRFTNGHTVADILGLSLNLSVSIPYWVVNEDPNATTTGGLNYASASAGIFPETGTEYGETMGMEKQINLLKKTIEKYLPRHFHTAEEIFNYLSKSIFAISIGSNDYFENVEKLYLNDDKRHGMSAHSSNLVTELEKHIKELYRLGARKMLLFEIGPLGCYPQILGNDREKGWCFDEVNNMISMFNGKLYYKLTELASTLDGTVFIIAKTYKLIYDMVAYPENYDIENVTTTCCAVNEGSLCIPGTDPCKNSEEHLFWDKFHLTEKANQIIARKCLNESSVCLPISMKKLGVEAEQLSKTAQPSHKPNRLLCVSNFLVQAILVTTSFYVI